MKRLWIPKEMQIPPQLAADATPPTATRNYALLINPFYPKDPHASFGKHVLTPSLALTSIAGATPERCLNLCGQTSLPEMVEWLRLSELTITNDTGPLHALATANRVMKALPITTG